MAPHDQSRSEHNLALRVTATDGDTNQDGDIFAGWVVSKMDLAAASLAGRVSRGRTATVAIKQTDFLSPVRKGGELSCYANVIEIGKSSIHISVEAWTRDKHRQEFRKVTEGVFIIVAIDEDGRIRQVPRSS
ncbi:acyl-CoA thioesterase [Allohahella marinimesophila]|uniref:Acyl-CoA thioesterase n=1 Tax=Allohahella marinimesophila TaxID=1054972 RepID=A0ABP7PVG7_9GAMM